MHGAYLWKDKSGKIWYRSKISHKGVSVSLGSFKSKSEAGAAFEEAARLYDSDISIDRVLLSDGQRKAHRDENGFRDCFLSGSKVVSIINHRDHNIYIKTPIYIRSTYFSYYLGDGTELKFDMDELFFYSSHRILKRGGSLYINDFGMQVRLLDRYGIHSFSVAGRDYEFQDGDPCNLRSANILVINPYFGVQKKKAGSIYYYECSIHLNGDYLIGRFKDEVTAATAYNKAVDYARDHGMKKQFTENYIEGLSPRRYADIYTSVELPQNFISFFEL
jgi:ATP-dependent Clp protease adapter protein ClpS